ncbi:hypothetical protein [Geodermatophilus telluris]|uniref:hypothetical protein n=1 Tax=Geodermatophilus telluris TaxID=1190417 RepID=UPI000B83240A|nr:hypothetical protein [Geodermatophilus telluris]
MTSLLAHRCRAVVSTLAEGVAVGAVLASRNAPPWSPARVRTCAGAVALVVADQLSGELPAALREFRRTGEVPPTPAHERRALVRAGVSGWAVGLLLWALDRPAQRALARRGVLRPHRWLGAAGGLAHAAAVAPVHWRLAADRAAAEVEREASVEAELQAMAAGR